MPARNKFKYPPEETRWISKKPIIITGPSVRIGAKETIIPERKPFLIVSETIKTVNGPGEIPANNPKLKESKITWGHSTFHIFFPFQYEN